MRSISVRCVARSEGDSWYGLSRSEAGNWDQELGKDVRELYRERLNAAIRASSVNNRALAKAVGVDPSLVTLWRNGKVSPGMHHLAAIADALGRPVPWFFYDASDPEALTKRLRTISDRIASDARELAIEAARAIEGKKP